MLVSRMRLLAGLSLGVVSTSFAAIFIRFAQAEGVPALSIAAWRLSLASLLLLPYALARHRGELRRLSGREWRLLAASGAFLGLHFCTWIASLDYTSVASSVVLVTMGPLFVGLGSWLFLGERPGPRLAAGIALAAAGSVAIAWGDLGRGEARLLGNVLALSGAVMMAGYLMIGRKVRPRLSLVAYTAPVYSVAALTVLVLSQLLGYGASLGVGGAFAGVAGPMLGFSAAAYGWMLAMALVPQLVGHSTLNWALRHLSATYVAVVTLAEPVGSGLLAYLLLGEAVGASTIVGGAVILTGIYIASNIAPESRKAAKAQGKEWNADCR